MRANLTRKEANTVIKYITNNILLNDKKPVEIIPVGSYRRGEKIITDIDFLVLTKKEIYYNVKFIQKENVKIKQVLDGEHRKQFGISIIINSKSNDEKIKKINVSIDLFFIKYTQKPFGLFHYTGPRSFNIRTRALAKNKGFKLNQYGLFRNDGTKIIGIKTEQELFKYLGITHKSPQNRE